jgi:hypothetical protein
LSRRVNAIEAVASAVGSSDVGSWKMPMIAFGFDEPLAARAAVGLAAGVGAVVGAAAGAVVGLAAAVGATVGAGAVVGGDVGATAVGVLHAARSPIPTTPT